MFPTRHYYIGMYGTLNLSLLYFITCKSIIQKVHYHSIKKQNIKRSVKRTSVRFPPLSGGLYVTEEDSCSNLLELRCSSPQCGAPQK